MRLATQRASSVTTDRRTAGKGAHCMSTTAVPTAGASSRRFSGAQHRLLAFSGPDRADGGVQPRLAEFPADAATSSAILQATSVNGVLAVAATLVIITGGIDLSVGTLMTFCAVIAGVVLTFWGLPLPLGVIGAILAGAAGRHGLGHLHRQAEDPALHRHARHDADPQGPVAGHLRHQADLFQRHARLHADLDRLADRRSHSRRCRSPTAC